MKPIAVLLPIIAAAIIIGCAGSSGSSGTTSTASTAGNYGVSMTSNLTFSPSSITVPAGGTVVWSNSGTMRHTSTSDTSLWNSDSQYASGVPGGSTYSFQVPANAAHGTVYYYHCEYHGAAGNGSSLGTGMAGEIIVQ